MTDEAPEGMGERAYPETFDALDRAQVEGLADMDPERFRAAAHAVVDAMADYLATVETRHVLPGRRAGVDPAGLPRSGAGGTGAAGPHPRRPRSAGPAQRHALAAPGIPGLLRHDARPRRGSSARCGRPPSARTRCCGGRRRSGPSSSRWSSGWLRDALGLPRTFDGLLTDTASTSTLIALAAAREAAGLRAAVDGLAARAGGATPVVYTSAEAHSSVEKACMTLGLGRDALRRIPVDDDYRMRVDLLEAAIADDRRADRVPVAIVATIGTTSSTSVDPVAAIADVAAREGLWLHVDAAYAGAVALIPGRRGPFAGWERADSLVVNPAQVALHPAGRLAPAVAPDGRDPHRLQPGPGVPAHA